MKARMLSVRARNALLTAIHGHPIDSNRIASCVADLNDSEPETVLAQLDKARRPEHGIRTQLMMVKGCGSVTANEILNWLGTPYGVAAHDCVCRDCGRKMPR